VTSRPHTGRWRAPAAQHKGQRRTLATKSESVESLNVSIRCGCERAPDALHGRDRQAAGTRHAARTPMRGVGRNALQRLHDDRFDTSIFDPARRAGPRFVAQAVQAVFGKAPPPPFTDRCLVHTSAWQPRPCFACLRRNPAQSWPATRWPAPSCAAPPAISAQSRSASLKTNAASSRPAITIHKLLPPIISGIAMRIYHVANFRLGTLEESAISESPRQRLFCLC
jgi:hypothetical protein